MELYITEKQKKKKFFWHKRDTKLMELKCLKKIDFKYLVMIHWIEF